MGQAGAIEVPIPAPRAPTLFARVGNWMALLAIVLLCGVAIAIRRRTR
jgi:apolipoprotein N-acyltransferase